MPKVALARLAGEWEQLLAGADEYEGAPEDLREKTAQLQELLERLRELENLRLRLEAERLQATRDSEDVRSQGKDLAMQIRLFFKSRYGLKDERLSRFGIRPRRRYAPRSRPTAPRTRKSTGR